MVILDTCVLSQSSATGCEVALDQAGAEGGEAVLGPRVRGHRAGNVLSGVGDRCNETAISARAAVM